MSDMSDVCRFKVVPSGTGKAWRVLMQRSGGRIQYINGFDSEAEAADWIEKQGGDWFAKSEDAANNI